MDETSQRASTHFPERGEPRLASCSICGHRHACYIEERPGPGNQTERTWVSYPVCLGCLMRASAPDPRSNCAECTFPA